MIKHYSKLLWKRRGKHAFLFTELVLVLWVLFTVFSLGIFKYQQYNSPLGFEWDGVYRVYFKRDTVQQTMDRIKRELQEMPEVAAASYSVNVAPYLGNVWSNGNDLNGMNFNTKFLQADEDYAAVWNIKMAEGRFFTKEDQAGKRIPLVVNKAFVNTFLQGKEALGFRFQFWQNQEAEIVGVMHNFRFQGDFEDEEPFTILPLLQPHHYQAIVLKVKPGTGPAIEKKINDYMEASLKSSEFGIVKVADQRAFKNKLTYIPLGILGFLAVFLIVNIVLGLFGILRYNIAKRIPEIGLRKALGASAANIKSQFTGEMMTLAGFATVVALVFALQVPLFTVLPFGWGLYLSAIGLSCLLIFTLVYFCSLAPSHQAAAILPAKALHEE
jgi:putative ABC transport system permease protein